MDRTYFSFLIAFLVLNLSFLQSSPMPDMNMNSRYILITGGAGFIGSHINEMLYRQGYQTVVLDNLSQGHREAVQHGIFIEGDLADPALLDQIFSQYQIDAVMHFAAFKNISESTKDPIKYYINNVVNTLNLLSAMIRHQVKVFIFSSSAAIFGNPQEKYVTEDHPCHPLNPYGQSKLMVENILKDLDQAHLLRFCSLRYFNAAGGDPEGKIKNFNRQDSNLIPIILRSLKTPGSIVTIYGTDYPTPDGTCIRDYIHIEDLGSAHIAAMEKLLNRAPSNYYNLGNGQGFSVRQVIAAVEKVTGQRVKIHEGDRRLGDAAILVANGSKAQRELNWHPRYSSLEMMIEHAWKAMH
jgi:UDP-glucose 4-epimerase